MSNNNEILKLIADDHERRKALLEYLVDTLKETAGNDALSGQDTSGYKEAKKVLTRAFDKIVVQYGKKKKKETINHAV